MPDIGLRELTYPKSKFLPHKDLPALKPILSSIAKTDILLSYPYHSFAYFIDLLREASIDPKVKTIKITLYRLAKHSSVIDALVNAARNGKHVITLLELQARFDEEANIAYGTLLREEGVKVLYGVSGLKVHAKLCLIERMEGKNLVAFAAVATGNFNEVTAGVYTDHMLLTADRRITQEVSKVFDFFMRTYQRENFNNLLLSPFNSRQKLIRLIGNEIEHARAGRKAYIHLKLNNLVDPEIITLLYQAAKAGVDVKLNIRGMCSLVPDRLSNIEARCIVDKYLEHTRVLLFCNNGDEKVFISSADLMTRNLDRRIEVVCPIYNKEVKSQLRDLFDISWRDNVKARIFDKNQSNHHIRPAKGQDYFRSQEETYKYLLEQSHEGSNQRRLKL
jgi:polyphosphate kinase